MLLHLTATLLTLGALFPAVVTLPASGTGERLTRPALDLAGMALTPDDITAVDLSFAENPEYGLNLSEMVFADDFVAAQADYLGIPDEDFMETLQDTEYVRSYWSYLEQVTDGDDGPSRMIVSYVVEFAEADGAADAWQIMQDESEVPGASDVGELDDLGDASEATLEVREDGDAGGPYASLEGAVLLGRLHFGVIMLEIDGGEPEIDDVRSLTELLLDKVEAAQATIVPALSNQVVRLVGETVFGYADAYLLRDGEAIPLLGEDPASLEEAADELGQVDEYRVWQPLLPPQEDPDDDAWYYLTVSRFVDEEAAEAWFTARPEQIETDENYTDVAFVPEDEAAYGDEAFAYTAEARTTGSQFRGVTFRIGPIVVSMDVGGANPIPQDAMDDLAAMEVACLEDRECLEPVELPASLEEVLS